MNKNWTVISLGGSLICPDKIDAAYLLSFAKFLKHRVSLGECFAIITGGGKVARENRDAFLAQNESDAAFLDWIGIASTRANAELLRILLSNGRTPQYTVTTPSSIFYSPVAHGDKKLPPIHDAEIEMSQVIIGGGYTPGHSSDGSAVALAKSLGAKKIINLSNIDYVYTDDPRKNPDAQPIEKMSWKEFNEKFAQDWNPGISAPFDPVAAKMAQELGLEVSVMNGKNLENLSAYLDKLPSKGTVIS